MKLMMDRMVCADGGNPDPTTTSGKDAEKAKQIELDGWNYPKHLAGCVYGVIVHGDVAGIEASRRALTDWLDWMSLVDAGARARPDRYIGYYEPYATSHDALDRDQALVSEVWCAGSRQRHPGATGRTPRTLRRRAERPTAQVTRSGVSA